MRSFIKITSLMILSALIFTGCNYNPNGKAITILNKKAEAYLAEGNTQAAIARLESSIDLDETIYKTFYNLGVAYFTDKQYPEALENLKKAEELNPDFPETFRLKGDIYENMAYDLILENTDYEKKEVAQDALQPIFEYLTNAVENYNAYLVKKEDKAKDKEFINGKIEKLNKKILEYNQNPDISSEETAEIQEKAE